MRQIPIFDTNIFGHVQEGLISEVDWRQLLGRRPRRGWPLSAVTALELLAGVHDIPSEKFPQLTEQVDLAFTLSNGRVLEEPIFLFCKEVLRRNFPADLIPPPSFVISCYMDVVRRARTREQLLELRVPFRGGLSGLKDTSVLKDLVAGPKTKWVKTVEEIASSAYADWRELFQKTGKRLPAEMRRELLSQSARESQRRGFVEALLSWLGGSTDPESVSETEERLDAVLEFDTFVVREFLTRDYSLENHASDVYDQFQLHYLAMDRFVIVTEDGDLWNRTSRSRQAPRIMSFNSFLQSL